MGLAVALLVVVLRMTPLTRGLFVFSLVENYAYDSVFDHATPQPPSDLAIVEIDDKSLRELGRFQSWHRNLYASLLDRLGGARVVAFDILFPEPDEDLTWAHSAPGSDRRRDEPFEVRSADEVFAQAIRRHGRVVLAAHWSGALGLGTGLHRPFRGGAVRGLPGETLVPPTPLLANAAAAVGYVDLEPDSDGVYRRFIPTMLGPDGKSVPHFATAIAALEEVATGSKGKPRELHLTEGRALINYCGPTGTIPRVSFVDVLRDPQVAASLTHKIVVVGATAPGLYDIRPAPYRSSGRVFFGVETNANIVNSILHQVPLRDASSSWAWGLFALALGVAVAGAVWTASEALASVLSLLILLVVAAPSYFVVFYALHQVTPYGAILWASALPLALGLPERLTAERRLIARQFGAYVSPDVLRQLMRAPDVLRQSHRRSVTLLFADVRGSTSLAEKTEPEVWVAQLNEYLTQMSLAIFAHDGYLDKFMGDGIMAVWNAFGTQQDNHGELAVRAGLQMLRRLDLLNRRWASQPDRTPLRIGIGIHSGDAVMGNVGSEERMQYTAIGDTVNTASRIEGMCKQYHAEFVVSEHTARLVGDLVPLRELGVAEVRGRSEGIRVFEVLRVEAKPPEGGEEPDAAQTEEEEA